MKKIKTLLNRFLRSMNESDLNASDYLIHVTTKLNTDEKYNLEACKTLININNMFNI